MPADQYRLAGALILAGLHAFGRDTPRRAPVLATLGTAAMRVIDRVHGNAAVMRHATLPTLATGFPDGGIHVVGIGYRPDRRHAAAVHEALLRRIETKDHVILISSDDLHVASSRACDLPTLANL